MINFQASIQRIICIGWWSLPDQLCAWAEVLVGKVDGCGYNGQQKDTICDVRGRCQTIWSIFKPVCHWFWLIGYAYKVPRCRDMAIFVVTTDRQTDYFTPVHARGVIMTEGQTKLEKFTPSICSQGQLNQTLFFQICICTNAPIITCIEDIGT